MGFSCVVDNTKYNCRISQDPLLSGDQYKILVGCNIPSDVNELWFISTHLFKCFSRLADAYFADCIAFFIFHSADLTVHLFLLNYAECFFFLFHQHYSVHRFINKVINVISLVIYLIFSIHHVIFKSHHRP